LYSGFAIGEYKLWQPASKSYMAIAESFLGLAAVLLGLWAGLLQTSDPNRSEPTRKCRRIFEKLCTCFQILYNVFWLCYAINDFISGPVVERDTIIITEEYPVIIAFLRSFTEGAPVIITFEFKYLYSVVIAFKFKYLYSVVYLIMKGIELYTAWKSLSVSPTHSKQENQA
jgi:hypothetical protein